MKGLKAGEFYVRNPVNIHQVSRIFPLSPKFIDGIIFWSKNPLSMIKRIPELEGYVYYLQFTLNAYGQDIEPNLPNIGERIRTFQELGRLIGSRKLVWRYDPIFFTGTYTLDFHAYAFKKLAAELSGYTDTCVISFLDIYRHIAANIRAAGVEDYNEHKQRELAGIFSGIAERYSLKLETCAEKIDLSEFGIRHSSCIDKSRLEELGGFVLKVSKDKNQGKECGCCESIDIEEYGTCQHGCIYCYARRNRVINPNEDRVTERVMKSLRVKRNPADRTISLPFDD